MKFVCVARCPELDYDNHKHCITREIRHDCPCGNEDIWIKLPNKIEVSLEQYIIDATESHTIDEVYCPDYVGDCYVGKLWYGAVVKAIFVHHESGCAWAAVEYNNELWEIDIPYSMTHMGLYKKWEDD